LPSRLAGLERLKELEAANAGLKRMYADPALENARSKIKGRAEPKVVTLSATGCAPQKCRPGGVVFGNSTASLEGFALRRMG
jgi:hypothetical protein